MPELPEVETVRRGIEAAVAGARLDAVELRRPDLRWPIPADLPDRVRGSRLTHLGRRSKYVLFHLDNGETLILHLGMSGRVTIDAEGAARLYHQAATDPRHDHVEWRFDNGTRIVLNDPRRFGALDIARTDALADHPLLARIGPEPLGNAFDAGHLHARLARSRTPIKVALLDQRNVAGLGNIYVNEALHRAGISPRRRAGNVSARRLEPLVRHIRDVLTEAIEAGGSSLRDHRQTDGSLGYFQHNFRVYDQEGRACPTEGCDGVIRRIVQGGRSTYHCPRCQR